MGHTADLQRRLWEHNIGKSLSTRGKGRWELVFHEEFPTRPEAVQREMHFISVDGRIELKSKGIL
ncbi:MAG TPA: endonuclease [candidate division Zixibacteria bacterium]|nr:endonuclease [candidate division Zixibacteria bacterium]